MKFKTVKLQDGLKNCEKFRFDRYNGVSYRPFYFSTNQRAAPQNNRLFSQSDISMCAKFQLGRKKSVTCGVQTEKEKV